MSHCFIVSNCSKFLDETMKFVEKRTYFKPIEVLLKNESYHNWTEIYNSISDQFTSIPFAELIDSVVLVDEYIEFKNFDPLHISVQKEQFWSRMILSFPELEFVFINSIIQASQTINDWINCHTSTENNEPFSPLFDFSELRNLIRKKINHNLGTENNLITRIKTARVIEDEKSFGYFHSYILYKGKHLTKLYTCLNHLNEGGEGVDVQIEDFNLDFIDKRNDLNLNDFQKRIKIFPFLNNSTKKVLITVGKNSDSQHLTNYKIIQKPSQGIFKIEEEILGENQKINDIAHKQNPDGHSVPGVMAFIAENLISRSQILLDNSKNIVDAIHAATLALEAKELLMGLNPTLSFQALSIQQKAEVLAESIFMGTEYNIDLKPRFEEIKKEVESIAKCFPEKEQERVVINTQLIIVENLSGIYSSYKQFEEEIECLNEARDLKIKLFISNKQSFKRHKGTRLIGMVVLKLLLTLSWSMKDWKNFCYLLLLMNLIFSVGYYFFLKSYIGSWCLDFSLNGIKLESIIILKSILSAFKYSFTTDSPAYFEEVFNKYRLLGEFLKAIQGFFSLTSLSIFLSMVYLRFSRR